MVFRYTAVFSNSWVCVCAHEISPCNMCMYSTRQILYLIVSYLVVVEVEIFDLSVFVCLFKTRSGQNIGT